MERIEYTAAQKKNLVTFEWAGRGDHAQSGLRAVKMARPICEQGCQGSMDSALRWMDTCKHGPAEKDGSPYWRMRQHIKKVAAYEPVLDAEGDPTGEYMGKTETRMFFTLEPNITEVVYSMSHNSGTGVQDSIFWKGFKFLPEIGVAPMCELKGCGKAWPDVRTLDFGDYCTIDHARLVGARLQVVQLPANDEKKRREMLRNEVKV